MILKHNKKFIKSKKAYTLLEMIVSLGIIGIILILFFNILTSVINASIQSVSRSFTREELATTTNLLTRDVRNADRILNCSTDTLCEMITGGQDIIWEKCDDARVKDSFCRYIVENGVKTINYVTSDLIRIDQYSFQIGYANSTDPTMQNIIFTVVASHINPRAHVNNIVRQVSISTRNYGLGQPANPGGGIKFPVCGNAALEGLEQCDDGNILNTDACLNTCLIAKCGDKFIRAGIEQCDDGNKLNTDACINTCKTAKCGDGYIRAGVEQCDDGNKVSGDGCSSTCQTEGGGGGGCPNGTGRTCCVQGTNNCDGCGSNQTKNYGDSCGGATNCRVCGASQPSSNACCL